jgi:hypothetical protein
MPQRRLPQRLGRVLLLCGIALAIGGGVIFWAKSDYIMARLSGGKTVGQRVEEFGPAVRERLLPEFQRIGMPWPPEELILVGLKLEERLEVWVGDGASRPKLLKTYPIQGASGNLGPKLREGDRQVPEGLYRIELLNPNSWFHLSLRVSYPNDFDRQQGKADGREQLGGDIMIHGGSASVGCLAMGDPAAEDLFILAAETGLRNIRVILSPVDFRNRELPEDMPEVPSWTQGLYNDIRRELESLSEPASR